MGRYNEKKRVPVVSGGGSVHVSYTVGDLRSITVNGGETSYPDDNGNINILVPRGVEVTDAVEHGEGSVPTSAAVALAIAAEALERTTADTALGRRINTEKTEREAADAALAGDIGRLGGKISTLENQQDGDAERMSDIEGDVEGLRQGLGQTDGDVQRLDNALRGKADKSALEAMREDVERLVEESAQNVQVEVDEQLDKYSGHPVANSAVAEAIDEIKGKTLAYCQTGDDPEDEGALRVSLLNKAGDEIVHFSVPKGGGGSGESKGVSLAMQFSKAAVSAGEAVSVQYTYDYKLIGGADSGASTGMEGRVTVEIIRNGVAVWQHTERKAPGTYSVDITEPMAAGTATVSVTVEVDDPDYDAPRTANRQRQLNVSTLTLRSDFDMGVCVASGGLPLEGETTAVIPFRVDGSGEKTVHCLVNGEQAGTQTVKKAGDNGQFRLGLDGYAEGSTVEVELYAETTVEGVQFFSQSIHIDLLKAPASGAWVGVMYSTKLQITNDELRLAMRQYEDAEVVYAAWSENATTPVTISIDGGAGQTVAADRTAHTYRCSFDRAGEHTLRLAVAGCTRTIGIDVEPSSVDISISTDYAVELSAVGRSNNDVDLDPWGSQLGAASQFTGVDWQQSGWTGESLRLVNGAKATIALNPFAGTPEATGMTLEMLVKISNPSDKTQNIISIGTASKGLNVTGAEIIYKTGRSTVYIDEDGNEQTREVGLKTNYQVGDEYKLIAFVVGSEAAGATMEMYVDGDRVSADVYPTGYSFGISGTQGIRLDSTYADVEVRKIRLYRRALDDDQCVDNAIADRQGTSAMLAMYNRNEVLTDTGDVSMAKLLAKGKGVLLLTHTNTDTNYGTGPIDDIFGTNNKSRDFLCSVYYTPSDAARRLGALPLELTDCNVRIQGTSSTKYPAKNLRIYINKGGDGYACLIGGEPVAKADAAYSLVRGVAAQTVLCAKKDYSDSSMSLNTGGARMFNDTFIRLGLLTPPQAWQLQHGGKVTARAAIYGTPIDVFVGASADDPDIYYLGQYNINNEKSKSGALFGMTAVEGFAPALPLAFESLNNTAPMCLMQCQGDTAEAVESWMGSTAPGESKSNFDMALEVNYSPHGSDGDVKWAGLTDAERAAVVRLYAWIKACVPAGADTDDIDTWVSQKFADEAADYFDIDYLLTYYLWTDYFMAVDQRAKNIMWRTWDGLKWYPTYYDGDTQMGKSNESYLKYPYTVTRDSWDTDFNRHVFEGHDSWLWCLVLANLGQRLRSCAAALREVLTNALVLGTYTGDFMGNWCEREYNKSAYLAYIKPMITPMYGHTWPYIYACQGRNLPHRQYMVTNRFAVLDAKYGCGDFINDNIDIGLSQGAADVSTFRLQLTESYAVGYGRNNTPYEYTSDVVPPDTDTFMEVAGARSGTDPMRMYGASRWRVFDATGAAAHLSNTVSLGKCVNLQVLDLSVPAGGTASSGWFFNVDGCRQLREVNLRGQSAACTGQAGSSVIDLSGQPRLEVLDCTGVHAATLQLPQGAPLRRLVTPVGLHALSLVGHQGLYTSALTVSDYAQLRSLRVQGCHFDTKAVVQAWLAAVDEADALTLRDISWSIPSATLITDILSKIAAVDITGQITVTGNIWESDRQAITEALASMPGLRVYFTGGTIIASDDTNPELMTVARARGWVPSGATQITAAQAAAVTSFGDNSTELFYGNTSITSLDELKYFTRVTSVPQNFACYATSLLSISFPDSVTFIDTQSLWNCTALRTVRLGKGLQRIKNVFQGCTNVREFVMPVPPTQITDFSPQAFGYFSNGTLMGSQSGATQSNPNRFIVPVGTATAWEAKLNSLTNSSNMLSFSANGGKWAIFDTLD